VFTGIVEGVATVRALDSTEKGATLVLEVGAIAEGVRIGDSVALDGCCLTVTGVEKAQLTFQAVAETLALTSLGAKRVGDRINLERALPVSGRLDGHIVQGHVDGTGVVESISRDGVDVRLRVSVEDSLAKLLVPKGSVAIDGVSLTVVDPGSTGFEVALIPHTLAVTTLGDRKPGDRVNLEADVLGKYVRHYLAQVASNKPG
jgi:riboflavin synthase